MRALRLELQQNRVEGTETEAACPGPMSFDEALSKALGEKVTLLGALDSIKAGTPTEEADLRVQVAAEISMLAGRLKKVNEYARIWRYARRIAQEALPVMQEGGGKQEPELMAGLGLNPNVDNDRNLGELVLQLYAYDFFPTHKGRLAKGVHLQALNRDHLSRSSPPQDGRS